MKVRELMERVNSSQTGKVIAFIKDGLEEINTIAETHVTTERFDITENQRFYELPQDLIKVLDIRLKNHLNNKDEYRKIPRLMHEPKIVDSDGV
tara:strand:- start:346 stop:627 length:282 start_codon:yes stop_codon:yes gene_type:complete